MFGWYIGRNDFELGAVLVCCTCDTSIFFPPIYHMNTYDINRKGRKMLCEKSGRGGHWKL